MSGVMDTPQDFAPRSDKNRSEYWMYSGGFLVLMGAKDKVEQLRQAFRGFPKEEYQWNFA